MPTIDINGFSKTLPVEIGQAEELQEKIWKALEGASYYDETLITRGGDYAANSKGSIVFLRLWLRRGDDAVDILMRLEPLNIRTQVFPIVMTELLSSCDGSSDRQKDQRSLPLEPSPTDGTQPSEVHDGA
jgi:hypothetical protein